eukprot:gene5556-4192_t
MQSVLEGMQLDQFSIFSTESPFEAPHRYGTQAQLLDLHTFAVQHNAISLQTTCAIALLRNWQQPLAPPPALTTHHASHPSHLSGTQASAISNNLATARDPPHFTSPVLDSGLAQLLEAVIHGYDPRSSAKSWVKALLDSIPDPTSSVTNDPYQQDNSAHEGGMSGYEYEMDPDDVYLGNTARHIPDDEAAINSGPWGSAWGSKDNLPACPRRLSSCLPQAPGAAPGAARITFQPAPGASLLACPRTLGSAWGSKDNLPACPRRLSSCLPQDPGQRLGQQG